MHKIREILRLMLTTALSNRSIGVTHGASHNTIGRYRKIVQQHSITDESLNKLNDAELALIIKPAAARKLSDQPPLDWERVHTEMQIKEVTLALLWEEYRLSGIINWSYSHLARLYRNWGKKLNTTMRQAHRAGEKMFVDFSGKTVPIYLPSGEVLDAQIFVAVLGASNYTYVEALRAQAVPEWVAAHVNAFKYFKGVPSIIVPDNLKSAVIKNNRSGVKLNLTYLSLAQHYQTAIVPARPKKPKDKAKVEGAVLLVQRWILARLRHYTFFSLVDLNTEIQRLLIDFNHREFKKRSGSRRSLYEQLDAPVLKPLPSSPYEYAEWVINTRVGRDGGFEYEEHFYTVDHTLVGRQVDLSITTKTIEVFHQHQRVASHIRSYERNKSTILDIHLPEGYRQYREWNPRRLIVWTQSVGKAAETVFEGHLESKSQRGISTCVSLIDAAKECGYARFEAACERALAIDSPTLTSIRSILRRKLDQQPNNVSKKVFQLPAHENIRGALYYQE